ncbi:hypothetical protein ACIBF5_03070 [Micromonospora sp. NPDC050417]
MSAALARAAVASPSAGARPAVRLVARLAVRLVARLAVRLVVRLVA